MVFHLREDIKPLVQVIGFEFHFSTSIEDFNVRPIKVTQFTFVNSLLKSLSYIK